MNNTEICICILLINVDNKIYLFQHIAAIFKKIFTENYTSTTYYYFGGIYYLQSLDEALRKSQHL